MSNPNSFENQSFRLPVNLTREAISQVITEREILSRRDKLINLESNKDYTVNFDTNNSESTPALEDGQSPKVNEALNYQKQLTSDVLLLVQELQKSIGSPEEHKRLMEELRTKDLSFNHSNWSELFGNNNREWALHNLRKMAIHECPSNLYYANDHVVELLNKHHYCTLVTTAVAVVVNANLFGSISNINNPIVADAIGLVLGAGTLGVTQVMLKGSIIENTKLDPVEIKPEVSPKRTLRQKLTKQPPKTNTIHHLGRIPTVKRFWMAAGLTTAIAGLSGYAHLTHLSEADIDELYLYERDKIADVVNTEAKKENSIFESYKEVMDKVKADPTNQILLSQKVQLETKSKILEFYSQQLEIKKEFDRCTDILNEARAKNKTLSSTREFDCRDNNTKTNTNGNISKNQRELKELNEQIINLGGLYRTGTIPLGPKQKNQMDFEKNATGESYIEILEKYYTAKGNVSKFHELRAKIGGGVVESGPKKGKEYPVGYYYANELSSKTRFEIGKKKFDSAIEKGEFPSGTTQAMLILCIELLALGTSATVMGDFQYRHIVLNKKVQNFSKEYLLDMAEVILTLAKDLNTTEIQSIQDSFGDNTNSSPKFSGFNPEYSSASNAPITRQELVRFAQKISQKGQLTGLSSIVEAHVSTAFGTPYNKQAELIEDQYQDMKTIPKAVLEVQNRDFNQEIDKSTRKLDQYDKAIEAQEAQELKQAEALETEEARKAELEEINHQADLLKVNRETEIKNLTDELDHEAKLTEIRARANAKQTEAENLQKTKEERQNNADRSSANTIKSYDAELAEFYARKGGMSKIDSFDKKFFGGKYTLANLQYANEKGLTKIVTPPKDWRPAIARSAETNGHNPVVNPDSNNDTTPDADTDGDNNPRDRWND